MSNQSSLKHMVLNGCIALDRMQVSEFKLFCAFVQISNIFKAFSSNDRACCKL